MLAISTLAYQNYCQKIIFPWVQNLFQEFWSAYSRPVPSSLKELYNYEPSAILSTTVAIFIFGILLLTHPIRCVLTIMIPTIGTKQGRRLLLSTCFMIVAFNIIPNLVTNITSTSQKIKCISQHSSEQILNSTMYFEAVTEDISGIVTKFIYEVDKVKNFPLTPKQRNAKISAHSEISLVERQILKTTESIKDDFLAIEFLIKNSMLVTNRILACFFIMYLLFNGTWYLKRYLTDIKFDNSYITNKLERLAMEKEASQVLSCSTNRLIRSTGLKLSKKELWTCAFRMLILSLFIVPTALIIASDHITFQFTTAVGKWIDNLPAMQIALQVKYNVRIKWFGAIKSNFQNSKEYPWNMTLVSSNCKIEASPPDNAITFTVGIIYCLMCIMIFLEAYAQRLRRKISASFYERREDERVVYLFEKLLRKHNGNVINT
ncbi:osteoclast stimulatory transmembrane protein [Discoglossus pictus]